MRKIFAILVICAIMLLSACQQAELPKSTDPPVQITDSSSYVEESKEPETQAATESTNASSQPVITEPPTTETTVPETTTTTEETKLKQTEPAQQIYTVSASLNPPLTDINVIISYYSMFVYRKLQITLKAEEIHTEDNFR